jgi:hypothetical protein
VSPRAALLLGCLALLACSEKSGGPNLCGHAATFDDGRPGACTSARTALVCLRPDGFGCVCTSDGEPCRGCGHEQRAACREECGPGEYAATCGLRSGPPPDGAVVIVYDDPPASCRPLDLGPGVPAIYCCPCQ